MKTLPFNSLVWGSLSPQFVIPRQYDYAKCMNIVLPGNGLILLCDVSTLYPCHRV